MSVNLIVLSLGSFFLMNNAHSYIGPGLGLGTIGVTLGVIFGVLLALFGILYYPLKRKLKNKKKLSSEDER